MNYSIVLTSLTSLVVVGEESRKNPAYYLLSFRVKDFWKERKKKKKEIAETLPAFQKGGDGMGLGRGR